MILQLNHAARVAEAAGFADGVAELVSLGRPLALEPELPRRLLDSVHASSVAPLRFMIHRMRGAHDRTGGRRLRRRARQAPR